MNRSKKLTQINIAEFIPKLGASLATYTGANVIDRIGKTIITEVISSILTGGNVRALTENLTKRRISLLNSSLLLTIMKLYTSCNNDITQLLTFIEKEISVKHKSKETKIFIEWMSGLTGKSIQNVLRSNQNEIAIYFNNLKNVLTEAGLKCREEFGELRGELILNSQKQELNWNFILYLFAAIGTQTLAIRGSEKSIYGKLFEKLILGSLLTILGFDFVKENDNSKTENIFWLSSRGNKRESDATLLYKPGLGIRFDIGFIGPGNTEISLDKVSRFEKQLIYAKSKYIMNTIVLVDRVGERSRITDMAKEINGNIVQMSMSNWLKEVCLILRDKLDFKSNLLSMSDKEIINHIKSTVPHINFSKFLSA
jgi:hypothetical protein